MVKEYSVFVDGTEINDYYLPFDQASILQYEFEKDWYENVQVIEKKYLINNYK